MSAPGWRVYVLRCSDGTLYTGVSNDVAARVARHDAGKGAAYTRARRPVTLVHEEAAADKGAALRREAAIKRLSRAEKLALVGGAARIAAARADPLGSRDHQPAGRRRPARTGRSRPKKRGKKR